MASLKKTEIAPPLDAPLPNVGGVILAGGKSLRMGQNKSLVKWRAKPLIAHCYLTAKKQVKTLIINTNNDERVILDAIHASASHTASSINNDQNNDIPCIKDTFEESLGPLCGIVSAMEWFKAHEPTVTWLMTYPCDTPLFPADLVQTLYDTVKHRPALAVYPRHHQKEHYTFGLWSFDGYDTLKRRLSERKLSLKGALAELQAQPLQIDHSNPALFFNVNTPEDLQHLEIYSL